MIVQKKFSVYNKSAIYCKQFEMNCDSYDVVGF